MNTLAQWEDSEKHRQIQFSIAYSIENSKVVITKIVPTKVTFVCPETNTALRSVGVHTDRGQTILRDQFAQSGKLDELVAELKLKNELLIASQQ